MIDLIGPMLTGAGALCFARAAAISWSERKAVAGLYPRKKLFLDDFFFRALYPLVRAGARHVAKQDLGDWRRREQAGLLTAGLERDSTADEFIAFRLVMAAVFTVLAALAWGSSRWLVLLTLLCGVSFPQLWQATLRRERQRAVRRDLPFAMDMLSLLMGAGLDFWSAMQQVVTAAPVGTLRDEFRRTTVDKEVGGTTEQALRGLASRIDTPEIRSLVGALSQACQLGTPMSRELEVQAESLRTERYHRAEAEGAKAATKLVFPVVLIALAGMLIIVGSVLLELHAKGAGMF